MKHVYWLAAAALSLAVSISGCADTVSGTAAASAKEETAGGNTGETVDDANTELINGDANAEQTSACKPTLPAANPSGSTISETETSETEATETETAEIETTETITPAKQTLTNKEAFARQIKKAVAESDIEALADLCGYPVYISLKQGEGSEINTRSELISLGADALFTREMKDAIAAVSESELEEYGAGVMMGENGTIVFNDVEGTLMITGINLGQDS